MRPSMQPWESDAPEKVLFSVRPSFLFVGVKYLVAAILWLAAAAVVASIAAWSGISSLAGAAIVLVIGIVLFAFPALAHLRRQRWQFTLTNYKLEIREGILSTTTRSVPLSKIQDVTMKGSFLKRLAGIGDLVVETAAESGAIVMSDIPGATRHADTLLRELHRWNRGDRGGV